MLQRVKEQWNSVDTDSLKKSVSGYLVRSPQAQADVSDMDSVSSEKAPSITELSEVSDPDTSRSKSRPRKSRELQELETRLEEQVKLKNRMADMLEQQQDKSKAESREVKRSYELKLQEQHAKLTEEASKKDKFLDKSKHVIQELSKDVQDVQKQSDMNALQHAMELEKCKKETFQSTERIKQLEGELQTTRADNEGLKQKGFALESTTNKLSLLQEDNTKLTKELSAMRDVMQNSTDTSEDKYKLLLEQVTSERDQLKHQCSSLQQQLTDAQRDSSAVKRELEDSNNTLVSELNECKDSFYKLESEKRRLEEESRTQRSNLQKEVDKLKKELKLSSEQSNQAQTVTENNLSEARQLLQSKEQEIVRLSGEGERQLLQISKLQKDGDRNVQELKSSIQKERNNVEELTALVEQVKLEKAQELESIYSTHDDEKQSLIDQNSELKQQVSSTEDQLTAVTSSSFTAHQKYKNELSKVEKDRKSMEDQVMKVKSERVGLQQKCLDLEKGVKGHKSAEEGWITQFEELTNKHEKSLKDMERLQMTVDLLNKELSSSKTESQNKQVELQTQLTLTKQQHEQERVEMLQTIDGLHRQIKILDQTILSNSQKSQQLNLQLDQVEGDNKQIQASLQSEVDRLNRKATESEQTLMELNTAKQMIEHKNDNLKTTIQERNNLQTQLTGKHHELEASVNQCEEISQANNELRQQILDISEKIVSLKTGLEEGVNTLVEGVMGRIGQIEVNLVGLEDKVMGLGRMSTEMKELRSSLTTLQLENNEYQEKLQKKSLEIKQLQQRQADLKKVMSRELKLQSNQFEMSSQEQQLTRSDSNGSLEATPLISIEPLPAHVIGENASKKNFLKSNSMLVLPTLAHNETDLIDLSIQSPLTEINFQYLRNIILQYMCSTPVEAKQLHRAIFTLICASRKEQVSVNQFWEYRESWFGYKAPPKFRSIIPESKEL